MTLYTDFVPPLPLFPLPLLCPPWPLETSARWVCVTLLCLPLTVSETSFSPAPTLGTTARHTYFPASSCRTAFRVRMFSLLRTWKRGGQNFPEKKKKRKKERKEKKTIRPAPSQNLLLYRKRAQTIHTSVRLSQGIFLIIKIQFGHRGGLGGGGHFEVGAVQCQPVSAEMARKKNDLAAFTFTVSGWQIQVFMSAVMAEGHKQNWKAINRTSNGAFRAFKKNDPVYAHKV